MPAGRRTPEERRHAPRYPIERRVYLSGCVQRLSACVMREQSVEGAYVEADLLLVSPGDEVTVLLPADTSDRVVSLQRLRARVVHCSARGAGLAMETGWQDRLPACDHGAPART